VVDVIAIIYVIQLNDHQFQLIAALMQLVCAMIRLKHHQLSETIHSDNLNECAKDHKYLQDISSQLVFVTEVATRIKIQANYNLVVVLIIIQLVCMNQAMMIHSRQKK
jgi:hypothetical protein